MFADSNPELCLDNLDKVSFSLPREILSYGTAPEGFHLPAQDREALKNTIADAKERNDFTQLGKHMDGTRSEIMVFNYIRDSLESKGLLFALFFSFKQMQTYRFLGIKQLNGKSGLLEDWKTEQEFDTIVLLPAYKKFVVVEVKNDSKFSAKQLKSLTVGKQFFDNLVNDNFLNSDWSYIPVLALPNKKCRQKQDSRQIEPENKLKFTMLTAQEIQLNLVDVLKKDEVIKDITNDNSNNDDNALYKQLTKIFVATAHSQSVKKSAGNVGLELICPVNVHERSHAKLFGAGAASLSGGFQDESVAEGHVKLSELKGTGVGDIKSFIFWNCEQYKFVKTTQARMLITGEYGTGGVVKRNQDRMQSRHDLMSNRVL